MKKISLLICSLFSLSINAFFGTSKDSKEINTDVKIIFKSMKTAPFISNFEYHENAKFAVELLQNLAEQQEHRALTMEEMAMVLRIISFLFLQETDDYSKGIEIILKNGKKLSIPYSSDLFATLLSANNANQSCDEKENA